MPSAEIEQQQVILPVCCPVCKTPLNIVHGVTQLFPDEQGRHHPTTIDGPGLFSARDSEIIIGCTGPAVIVQLRCLAGHSWAWALREHRCALFPTVHHGQDWDASPEQRALAKQMREAFMSGGAEKAATLKDISAGLTIPKTKRRKPKPKSKGGK